MPNHHRQWPLSEYPEFIELIAEQRRAGAEIFLHGLEHLAPTDAAPVKGIAQKLKARFLTAGEGEFQSLKYYETARRLRVGREVLKEHLHITPTKFVAPAWLENFHTTRALRALDFELHEDHLFIEDLRRQRRFFVPAITFTGRSPARARASVAWARALRPLVATPVPFRLALHPVDFDHDELVEEIGRFISAISSKRQWVTYDEFLGQCPRAGSD